MGGSVTIVTTGKAMAFEDFTQAIQDFKPGVTACRVPGKLGTKLQTRQATLLTCGESPPKLRTMQSNVVKLPAYSANRGWVIRVSAQWHYTRGDWQALQKHPWKSLRRWIAAFAPDAKQDLGDTWRWQQNDNSVVQGYL